VTEATAYDDRGMDGYRRISATGGQRQSLRDLAPIKQDQMVKLAFLQWEGNPLAQFQIEILLDFVLGEGAQITSDIAECREVLENFCEDPVNQLDRRLAQMIRGFRLYGELCTPVAVNDRDGHVRIADVDPLDIVDVITDRDNILIQRGVLVRPQSGIQSETKYYKVLAANPLRGSETYNRWVPAEPGEYDDTAKRPYDGSCFLWQTNKVSNARRGRSDLLSTFDWNNGYDNFMYDSMDIAGLLNSFVWDIELQGMTDAQIDAWMKKYRARLARAGTFAHNEKVKLTPQAPNLQALDKDAYARVLRGHILGSKGIPEYFYGQAGGATQGSAKEMGLPAIKRLTRIQKEVRYILSDLARFALDQAIIHKQLKPTYTVGEGEGAKEMPAEKCFRVILPELSMKDQSATVAALTSLVAALGQAEMKGWVRPETSARLFAFLASQLGLEVKAEDEYTPGVPAGDALAGYANMDPTQLARLTAQLGRQGAGNGANINQPKATTPVGGNTNQ